MRRSFLHFAQGVGPQEKYFAPNMLDLGKIKESNASLLFLQEEVDISTILLQLKERVAAPWPSDTSLTE
jgi:hypothetical protein